MIKLSVLYAGQKETKDEGKFYTWHDALCFLQDVHDEGANIVIATFEME